MNLKRLRFFDPREYAFILILNTHTFNQTGSKGLTLSEGGHHAVDFLYYEKPIETASFRFPNSLAFNQAYPNWEELKPKKILDSST